ncbi:FKBP-type peptidyl-prolyl cis-trans isomerase [Spirilliplanes yamanashiensis]|nr:FKBP-type peptidyl-prolyl cis-trans isomerase [Spirilliplanes yamanashiensis]MDP9817675.1 peptidylprolyl isomerase [Spirilliplanes yamanashiensis]
MTDTQTTPVQRADRPGRAQALIGVLAGLLVVAVVVGVFVAIRAGGGSGDPQPPAAAPATSAPAAEPPAGQSAAPSAPAGAEEPPQQGGPAGLDPALQTKPEVKAGTGAVPALKVTTLVRGKGPAVEPGQTIAVNYVGVLYKTGEQFDSSWDRGQPAQFPIGTGNVIEGWDRGLVGVPVGSRVQLDIPAAQAYGDDAPQGAPAGDLRFVVDILAAQ